MSAATGASAPALAMRLSLRPCLEPPAAGPPPALLIRRGALSMTSDGLRFWYEAASVPLSGPEAVLFASLLRRGRMCWADIDSALPTRSDPGSRRHAVLRRIRQKFARVDAPDPIRTVRNWGIRLHVPPDRSGSTSLIIGERVTAALRPTARGEV